MRVRNPTTLRRRVDRVARWAGQAERLTPETLRKMTDAELAAEMSRALAQSADDDPLRPQLETARKQLIDEGLRYGDFTAP